MPPDKFAFGGDARLFFPWPQSFRPPQLAAVEGRVVEKDFTIVGKVYCRVKEPLRLACEPMSVERKPFYFGHC